MTALQITQEEIGSFDYEAAKARKARMWGAPVVSRPRPLPVINYPVPAHIRLGKTRYLEPIGPVKRRDWIEVRTPTHRGQAILEEVAKKHGINPRDIIGPWRKHEICVARFEAVYRLREELMMSFPQIGRFIGGRDHTSALAAYRRFKGMLEAGEAQPVLLTKARALPLFQDNLDG